MKVGILTFPHSPSYGASLQMFALHEILKIQGHTPYIINYQNIFMTNKQHMTNSFLKAKLTKLVAYKSMKKFDDFENKLNWLPQHIVQSKTDLDDLAKKMDYIVVGSDQVWNPYITGFDTTYFLDFCQDDKKISYAASFGVDNLDDDFATKVSELIAKIPSLSIREEKGAQIIKNITNRDAIVVLDPTFLHRKEMWESVATKKELVKQPYIFSFIFNPNKQNIEFRDNLSKDMNLPIVSISDNPFSKSNKNHIYMSGVGPLEFLKLIKEAEYIVTDSFHGTAFSIIFNKLFFVSLSTKTNSRLETMLKMLGLESRIISNDGFNMNNIDYDKVNEKMLKLKNDSLDFLRVSLSGEHKNE